MLHGTQVTGLFMMALSFSLSPIARYGQPTTSMTSLPALAPWVIVGVYEPRHILRTFVCQTAALVEVH